MDTKLESLLHDIASLPYEFNVELEWDTDGMPDGEACDKFGNLLMRLQNEAQEILERNRIKN